MIFDMKSARDCNTVSCWSESIWRMFIGEKLFISDSGQTCFNTMQDTWDAFYNSTYWKRVSEYVDHSQKFFNKTDDPNWRKKFEDKIIEKLDIVLEIYKPTNQAILIDDGTTNN